MHSVGRFGDALSRAWGRVDFSSSLEEVRYDPRTLDLWMLTGSAVPSSVATMTACCRLIGIHCDLDLRFPDILQTQVRFDWLVAGGAFGLCLLRVQGFPRG